MSIKIILVVILFVLVISYFGVATYIATELTLPAKGSEITFDKEKIGRGADIVFRSLDGTQLAGTYFSGTNGRAILFAHGASPSNRYNEGYGTPEIAKYFLEKGYTILLFDMRGVGQSQKTRIGLGQTESLDVAAAFNYLVKMDFKPENIGIIGTSLGAIATIIASDNVKDAGGIVLDAPAATMKEVVSGILVEDHNVPKFMHPGIYLMASLLYNIDINKVRPIDYVSALNNTPILFIYEDNDTRIPPDNVHKLIKKVANAMEVGFPTTHTNSYMSDKIRYLELIANFFETHLKRT